MNTSFTPNSLVGQELDNLPDHYYETFSEEFLVILAALRVHGFRVLRADEARQIAAGQDLWSELGYPSIEIASPSAPKFATLLREAAPGSPEHAKASNDLIRVNLAAQQKLLRLLEKFYENHQPSSFYTRLIVETVELGESVLRPQGAGVSLLMTEADRSAWIEAAQTEISEFGKYLATR